MAGCEDGSCELKFRTLEEKRKEYQHSPSNAYETWKGLRDDLIRIGHRYYDHTIEIDDVEELLHDAWDELIHAAKVIPSGSSEHDRLVTLILEMRELGTFERSKTAGGPGDERTAAVTSKHELLWTDIPCLADDLQKYWVEESSTLSGVERRNLATFTAKLCGSGVCAASLSSCALWLFRQALEIDRSLTVSSSPRDANTPPTPLTELLPACVEWLTYSNFKLAQLSATGHCPMIATILIDAHVPPQNLALDHTFSMQRWLFWRQKFGELYVEGLEGVSKPARKCFELMISTGHAIGLDMPGEKKYLDQVFKALEKELVIRGSKGCVTPEDIGIDPTWANEP